MLQGFGDTSARSKRLRREMSLPEIVLWRALRERPGGFKFRKSHPAGFFTADFYCHQARLVIEVDGEAHERGDRPARDARRDSWFAQRNIGILRVTAQDVLRNLDGVVGGIVTRALGKNVNDPNSSPARGGGRRSRTEGCHQLKRSESAEGDTPPPSLRDGPPSLSGEEWE